MEGMRGGFAIRRTNVSKDQKRLGRSLSSLLPPSPQGEGIAQQVQTPPPILDAVRGLRPANRLGNIPLEAIRRNPLQPRRTLDDAALTSLAESIRERGTLQPVVVRPADGGYELIAGERRLRASKIAGLREIPAIIRASNEEELLELALIENIQRTDLNAVDRARAYRVLHETYGLSHEEIGRRMGEDRATVTNYIRLLGLPDDILDMVVSGSLSLGHAKIILGITDSQIQHSLADRVSRDHWSVRRLERAVATEREGGGRERGRREQRPAIVDIENRLSAVIGAKVRIQEGRRRHSGRIIIEFYGLDDFQRVTKLMGLEEETA